MADIALVTAGRLRPISGVANGHEQYTFEASERIDIGTVFRYNLTTGKAEPANATTLVESGQVTTAGNFTSELFVAIDPARQAGNSVTGMKKGELDGYDLGTLNYGAPIYVSNTDGRLADAAGTTTTIIGRVRPAPFTGTPSGADRVLAVQCPPVN